jgi:hypothetical protein
LHTALPSADGRFIFTPWGIVDRNFKQAKMPELSRHWVVPATEPGYFLALTNGNPGYAPENLQGTGEAIFYTEDRKRLFALNGLDELKTKTTLGWEKRVHFYPRGSLLVTLSKEKDRLLLRRVDVKEQLEASGADYLVVLSRPPVAKPGAAFTYKVEVCSKKGGVKVKVESGPAGLSVTPQGQVTWNVPAKVDEFRLDVVLSVADASGQEVLHAFTIELAER